MKTLSLHQPWASLLAHGAKKVETRPWRFPGRLPAVLAVHAAKRWNGDLSDVAHSWPFGSALIDCGWRTPSGHFSDRAPPLGCVLGLVRLRYCVPTERVGREGADGPPTLRDSKDGPWLWVGPTEQALGDYSPGRWAWLCDAFAPLPGPLPLRGRQGVFDWEAPPEVEALARGLLAEGGSE